MDNEYYKKIFSQNLKHYMELNEKNQIDIINDLGFNKSAVSTWCNGTRLPRMDKVDALAKYFRINRSDLIEDKPEPLPAVKDALVPRESRVIEKYRRLDEVDKGKIDERMDTMLEGEKYKKVELLDVREIS